MRHFPVQQGSQDWLRLRMGRPTASEFERIITPAKKESADGKILGWQPTKSETRKNYKIYLLTELILDMPLSGVTTASMQHGTDWEMAARDAYAMQIGREVELCGFCTNDEFTYGATPDAFVGEDGSLEIKVPHKPEIHVAYLMEPASLEEEYFVQTQGQLFVTGRKWTDLISYHSVLPMVKVRVLPEPEFQKRLKAAVHQFCAEFSDLVCRAIDLGYLTEKPTTTDWITAGDVEMVRAQREGREPIQDPFSDEEIEMIYAATQKGNQG